MTQVEFERILKWLDEIREKVCRGYNQKYHKSNLPNKPEKWSRKYRYSEENAEQEISRLLEVINYGYIERYYFAATGEMTSVRVGKQFDIIDEINTMALMVGGICFGSMYKSNRLSHDQLTQTTSINDCIKKLNDIHQCLITWG